MILNRNRELSCNLRQELQITIAKSASSCASNDQDAKRAFWTQQGSAAQSLNSFRYEGSGNFVIQIRQVFLGVGLRTLLFHGKPCGGATRKDLHGGDQVLSLRKIQRLPYQQAGCEIVRHEAGELVP